MLLKNEISELPNGVSQKWLFGNIYQNFQESTHGGIRF